MNNIQIDIDIAAAQTKFEELMAAIDQTRSKLAGLKKTSEEYKEISRQLAEQEEELVDVINQLGDSADYSQISYRNLSQTMGEVNKIAKDNTLEVRTQRYTKSLAQMNAQLKAADAQIGSYGRNVGNYGRHLTEAELAMARANKSVMAQTQQLIRELPTLSQSPEMFLLAISNNLPYLLDAFKQVDDAVDMMNDNGNDLSKTADKVTQSSGAIAAANSAMARSATEASIANTRLSMSMVEVARHFRVWEKAAAGGNFKLDLGDIKKLGMTKEQFEDIFPKVKAVNGEYAINAAQLDILKQKTYELAQAQKVGEAAQSKFSAKLGAVLKGSLSWVTVITLIITLLRVFWPLLKKGVDSMRKVETSFEGGSRSLKQWNEALREANESAAKSATELIVYSRWATMASKSDEERSKAADKVVEIMKEHNEVVDVAGVKAGNYKDKIDEVTAAMVKQAQAEAMLTTITEKYKKVLDAQSEVYEIESRGEKWIQKVGDMISEGSNYGTEFARPGFFELEVGRAKNDAEKAKQEFEGWLDKFLKDFNPSDLLDKEDKKGGKGSADKWFSRWELRIKEREALLQKSEKEGLEYTDKEWWKYTQQGIEYHKKMFDEYRTHYAGDEKELSQLLQREREYYAGFALYVQKIRDSYIHPDYSSELNALNEWYTLEYIRLSDLGLLKEKQADLDKEYLKRLFELNKNYRDEFTNAGLYFDDFMSIEERDMHIQLNELDQWFEDQKTIYKQKGIDITNLELEYLRKQAEIRDTWRQAELQKDLAFTQQTANLKMLANESSLVNSTNPIRVNRTGAAVNGGFNGMNAANERAMEIEMLISNFDILKQSIEDQITLIESAEFESLDAQIQAEQQASELKMQLAEEEARYKMELNQMVKEDAVEKWNEQLEAVSSTFNVFGDLFGNIGALMEEGSEEAKGFAVAAAAMSAIASAVEAYKSTVGIPYVGPFLAPVAAASALLAGAANVKQILATKTDGSNALSSVQGAYVGATPPQVSQAINATATTTGLSEQTNLNNQSIRAYVVDSDVAEGLNRMSRRNSETSF